MKRIFIVGIIISLFAMMCTVNASDPESAVIAFAEQLNEAKENSCEINGEKITLLSDITLKKSLSVDGTVYFDLNGYNLTADEGLSAITVGNGATFYIEGEGNITGGANGGCGIYVIDGDITVNGGNINGSYGIYSEKGTVVVESGIIEGSHGVYAKKAEIYNGCFNGEMSVSGEDITIYDGIFNGTVSVSGNGVIKGGIIKGNDETAQESAKEGIKNLGTLTVEGGTITGGNGISGSGAAGITAHGKPTLVKGGTIIGGNGYSGGDGISGRIAMIKTEGGIIIGGNGTNGNGGDGINIGTGTAEIKNTKVTGGNGSGGGTGIIGEVIGSSNVFATVKAYNCEITGGNSKEEGGGTCGYGIYTTKGEIEVGKSTIKSGKGKSATAAISAPGGKITVSYSDIYGEGGTYGNMGISANNATVTVTNSNIYGGSITEGIKAYEGADAISASYGIITVTDSNIYGGDILWESADNTDSGTIRGGDGIAAPYGTVTATNCNIYGGNAKTEGDAYLYCSGSAIYLNNGKITVANCCLYSGNVESKTAEQSDTNSAVSANGSTIDVSESIIHSGNICAEVAESCSTGDGISSGKMPVKIVNSEIVSGDIVTKTGNNNSGGYGVYASGSTLEIIKSDIQSGSILTDESEYCNTYPAVCSNDGILKITDGSHIRTGDIKGEKIMLCGTDAGVTGSGTIIATDSEVNGGSIISTVYMNESYCGEGIDITKNSSVLTLENSNVYGGNLTGNEGEMNNAGKGIYINSSSTTTITDCNIYGGNVAFETGTDCYSGKGIDTSYVDGAIILENSNVFGGNASVTVSKYCDGGKGIDASRKTVTLKNSTVSGGNGGDALWSSGGKGIDAKNVILYDAMVSGGEISSYNCKAIAETFSTATGFVAYGSDNGKKFTLIEDNESNYKYIRACDANNIAVMGIELDKSEITIGDNGIENLIATLSPVDAKNKNIIWTSSDESVATVKHGTVRGVSPGIATISATTEDGGLQASCTVNVYHSIPSLGNEMGKITFTIQTSHTEDSLVYAVLYDSNRKVQDVKIYPSQNSVTVSFDADANASYIKVMEWYAMRPLTETKIYYLD